MKKTTPQTKFEEIPCNLCGSEHYKVMYPAQHDKEKDKDLAKKFRASGDELLIDQLVKCKRCSLQYVNPRVKEKLIIQGYSVGDDPVFVSQATARERTFFSALKGIEKYIPQKGKVLDVGTAGGSFLSAAKRRGWEVYGCEPNKWMAAWGKKMWMKHGALDYRECQGDDLKVKAHDGMKPLSYAKLTKAKSNETVWFSYIVFKNKAHRNAVNTKVMKDPVMNDPKWAKMAMPFDPKRMAYGGFKVAVC